MGARPNLAERAPSTHADRCIPQHELLISGMVCDMTERERILDDLGEAGVLLGIQWSYESAARRTREDYDEPTGHDTTWVGMNRWKLLCDRLDRVFSCGKYATKKDSPEGVGLDILYATLTPAERDTFPHIPLGTVLRDNVLGSPGWSTGEVRWLLASARPGGVDNINWSRRSPLKQRTAKQPDPDTRQMSIFDGLIEDPITTQLQDALRHAHGLDRTTLIVTHAHEIDTDARELYIGLPSMETPGRAWAWKQDLLDTPPSPPSRQKLPTSEPDNPGDAPDAPVRLRKPGERAQPNEVRRSAVKSHDPDVARAAEGR